MIQSIVDTERYPIGDHQCDRRTNLTDSARSTFLKSGVLQLKGFLRREVVTELATKCHNAKHATHRMHGEFPPYSDAMDDAVDKSLPADHPARLTLPASHLFLPGDMITSQNPLRVLYRNPAFQSFLQHILCVPQLHPVQDDMGNVNLLIYEPGDQNGWHFDTTDFVVSIMLQSSTAGGIYQYVPDLRSEKDQNLQGVTQRMQHPDSNDGVLQCDLEPGTLFLFKGKYTMHRVTRVAAQTDRIIAILSYHPKPGHTISNSSKRAMYGREKPIESKVAI